MEAKKTHTHTYAHVCTQIHTCTNININTIIHTDIHTIIHTRGKSKIQAKKTQELSLWQPFHIHKKKSLYTACENLFVVW